MRLELREGGPAVETDLDDVDAAALRSASTRWRRALRSRHEPLQLTRLLGRRHAVNASGVAGFVRVGRVSVDVLPKFLAQPLPLPHWRRALWRLLAYGHGVELFGVGASGATVDDEGIADVLADVFLASVSTAAVRGYPLGYRQQSQTTDVLRGRIDPQRLHEMLPFTGTLPLLTSRLTDDVPTNRLLVWTAEQLARQVESPGRGKALRAWRGSLPGVISHPPTPNRVADPKRQHPHLVPAVAVGQLLLSDRSASYATGPLDLPGFLWETEGLFERAVLRLFREAARPLGLIVGKRRTPLLRYQRDGALRTGWTTPDVDVQRAGRTVLLADAKYKVLSVVPDNSDVYQVLAGGRVTSVPVVALVYPTGGHLLQVQSFVPEGAGDPNRLDALLVGLEAFSSAARVRALQADLTEWLATSTGSTAFSTTNSPPPVQP